MTTETGTPRSRRALLAAGAAAGVATVASALGRPSPVSAASGSFDSADSNIPAVSAKNTAASGFPAIGVSGQSDSTGGSGVVGRAAAATGFTSGVWGESSSTSGYGVLGYASAGSGTTYGVWGESASASGIGVFGIGSGVAVRGQSTASCGLLGTSNATGSAAVLGRSDGDSTGVIGKSGPGDLASPAKTGVYGYADQDASAIGVLGSSPAGTGLRGESTTGTAITALSTSGLNGIEAINLGPAGYTGGLSAVAVSPAGVGVWGQGAGGSGVIGISGADPLTAAPARTGVYGYAAQDATARGVYGTTTAGQGVRGQATTGTGVYATATTGYALRAVGRVKLDKCAGVATILAGTKSIVVTPGIDLVSTSAVVATLMGSAGGTTNVHRVSVSTTLDTFTIYLTANSTANVKVAWIVLG